MRLSFIVVLVVSVAGCKLQLRSFSNERNTMQETENFHRSITTIANDVKSLGVPDELFASRAFVVIYETPQTYLSSAIKLTGSVDVSTHEKLIIGYAMQRLPREQFVAYVSAIANSVERGTTDIKVLESTAFAPLNWGRQSLIMNYQDPQVVALLVRLMNMKQLSSDRKAYIRDRMLTGLAKQDYLAYMDMIGRPVKEE